MGHTDTRNRRHRFSIHGLRHTHTVHPHTSLTLRLSTTRRIHTCPSSSDHLPDCCRNRKPLPSHRTTAPLEQSSNPRHTSVARTRHRSHTLHNLPNTSKPTTRDRNSPSNNSTPTTKPNRRATHIHRHIVPKHRTLIGTYSFGSNPTIFILALFNIGIPIYLMNKHIRTQFHQTPKPTTSDAET